MAETDIPDPIADDAPTPDEFESDDRVRTPGTHLTDIIAADYNGERYCLECISDDYLELARNDPYSIPYGGVVTRGSEVDYKQACGHCLRVIEGFTILDYDD